MLSSNRIVDKSSPLFADRSLYYHIGIHAFCLIGARSGQLGRDRMLLSMWDSGQNPQSPRERGAKQPNGQHCWTVSDSNFFWTCCICSHTLSQTHLISLFSTYDCPPPISLNSHGWDPEAVFIAVDTDLLGNIWVEIYSGVFQETKWQVRYVRPPRGKCAPEERETWITCKRKTPILKSEGKGP